MRSESRVLALSIRQPWVWAILNAGKRVENRTQRWDYRGEVLLHASLFGALTAAQRRKMGTGAEIRLTRAQDTVLEELEIVRDIYGIDAIELPRITPRMLFGDHLGAIVGKARIVDCVEESDSQWFVGPFGLVLEDVRPLAKPVPCKGALGLWIVPPDVIAQIQEAA